MRILPFTLLLLLGSPLFAQVLNDPQYFDGDPFHPVWMQEGITEEYFPEADAVIIQDYCWVFFETTGRVPRVSYQYLRRIKINTEEGRSAARMSFDLQRVARDEALLEWKAITYSLNAEGEVVEFPVAKRDIDMVEEGGVTTYSVDLPFAKPGSVLELRYQIQSSNFDQLRPWRFQGDLPVIRSAITTYIPYSYKYLLIATGDISSLVQNSESYHNLRQSPSLITQNQRRSFERNDLLANQQRYSGEAVTYSMMFLDPVVEREVFAPEAETDYLPSLSWQLSRDNFTRQNNEFLFDSWGQLDRQVLRRFGERRIPRGDRKNLETFAGRRDHGGRWAVIQRMYLEFSEEFEWDGSYEVTPSSPGRAWRNREGSAAELNMLLLTSLREAGIEAYPVLISTRDHGYVQDIYPLLSQFNHVLVAVDEGGEKILLDVVGGMPKAGLLPRTDLNGEGFLLNGRGGEWVPLQSYQRVNQVTYSRLTMQEDGTLSGEVSVVNQGFSSELESIRLTELGDDPEAYFRKYVWAGENPPLLSSSSVEQDASREDALKMTWEVSMDEYVLKAEDVYILQPMLMRSLVENPFVQDQRISPIDLTYPLWEAHMLGLRIPEGYEIAQSPQSIRVMMPNNAGQFIYHVMQMGNIVHVTSSIQINRTRYHPAEYQAIKDFFDYIVAKHQEDIVIKKVE